MLAFPLVNHHLREDFARLGIDFCQTLPGCRTRQRLLAPGGELVSGRGGPIGTQVTAPTCHDVASCAQGPHFAIADDQDRRRPQRRDRRLIGGDIQPIIGAVASHGLAHQRQAQRIERRQHGFELSQVGALVFAVALVEKALIGRGVVIHTDTGTIQAHGLGRQAIDPHPFLQHRPIQGGLGRLIAQHRQDIAQTIVGAIGVTQCHSKQGVEGLGAFRHPVAHRYEAMLRSAKMWQSQRLTRVPTLAPCQAPWGVTWASITSRMPICSMTPRSKGTLLICSFVSVRVEGDSSISGGVTKPIVRVGTSESGRHLYRRPLWWDAV